jgi:hypothetical protein
MLSRAQIDYVDYGDYSDDGNRIASVLKSRAKGVTSSNGLPQIWPHWLEGLLFLPGYDAVGLDC